MERNTEETQFLSETEEYSGLKRKKKSRKTRILMLWLVLGVASTSFIISKFFWN